MVGKYRILLQDRYVKYDFYVKRKFTILNGDSSTGKSVFAKHLEVAEKDSSVVLSFDVPVRFPPNSGVDTILKYESGNIYVIDESCKYLKQSSFSNDFASLLMNSDNYFIIITRKKLSGIPYSVKEIYYLTSQATHIKDSKHENESRI